MANKIQIEQNFIIDKLTDSILNTISGDSFQTEVSRMTSLDLKNITKKNKWNFDWKVEFSDFQKEVYKLTIVNNSSIIQGLLSITIEQDHIYMNLLESSPFNIGKNKLYEGVAGNLATYYLLYGDVNLINTEIEMYRSITREEIREVAKKYLNPNQRLILNYIPTKEKAKN